MSKLVDRYRTRREYTRRARAIEKALSSSASSPAMRQEITSIANRPI